MCEECNGTGVVHIPFGDFGVMFQKCHHCEEQHDMAERLWEKRLERRLAEYELEQKTYVMD